ncbi:helix-turn-helix domain-containing protein [Phytohalomonas tamaricis]|uniref:helix-turn-helix domain-containing protein n=1 Tax=Phytohalomonas tamaricis TaxID=2081032 RepID=UPI000D0AF6FC|nr:helix-turn-helix domain-containing protein [Phytohalomonas tamaricis]
MTAWPEIREASTEHLPIEQRLAYWEEYNASRLVSLKCSSFAAEGLAVRQKNIALEQLRLAMIVGNEHVIERGQEAIRLMPKDSVFVCLIQKGNAFFYQGKECLLLNPGDMVVYPTDKAYMYGFTCAMEQIIIDIPRAVFGRYFGGTPDKPTAITAHDRANRLFISALHDYLHTLFVYPHEEAYAAAQGTIHALLGSLIRRQTSNPKSTALMISYLIAAKHFIRENIDNPGLTCATIAQAVGISERHLNRLFASEETSTAQFIIRQRLERAYQDLRNPCLQHYSIGEIAYRYGFNSQAHFSRSFKQRFNISPSHVQGLTRLDHQ